MFYLLQMPRWLRPLYAPGTLWEMPADSKTIYLSFDDGPHPEITGFCLDQLARFDAKATFFCIGKNAAAHPEVIDRIRNAGHRIGNHTWHHANGWKTAPEFYRQEIMQTDKLLHTPLFRPPYGKISRAQLRFFHRQPHSSGQPWKVIMWTALSGDFDTRLTAKQCFENVRRFARPGAILVFHDSEKAWPRLKECLPDSLRFLQEEGYAFGLL